LERTTLLFPTSALACVEYLRSMAQGRLGLLVADKGYHTEDELDGRPDATISRHGRVSMMVNYHALGEYVRLTGGVALHPLRGALRLVLGAYLYGAPEAGCPL
jgi:hypothetical protein